MEDDDAADDVISVVAESDSDDDAPQPQASVQHSPAPPVSSPAPPERSPAQPVSAPALDAGSTAGEEVDSSSFAGRVALILDVHYLEAEFSVPADASFARFESALASHCGGGPICARYACDVEPDGEPLPARQRLHEALRQSGYTLLLAAPRPLSGMPGTTDLDITCCILASAGRSPPPLPLSSAALPRPANVLALVSGDADFSGVLAQVLPPPRRAATPASTPMAASDAASPAPTSGAAAGAEGGASSPVASPAPLSLTDGLRACVLVSELGSASSSLVKHVDLLAMLPALVPGIDLRDASLRRERRRRTQAETAAKVMQRERALETKRWAKEEERAAKKRAKAAEVEAKQEVRQREIEEKKRKKEEEKEEKRKLQATIPTSGQRDKWRVLASKKGFAAGLSVEAPLMNGGDGGEFDGSWYSAVIIDCGQKGAKVRFEHLAEMPEGAAPAPMEIHEPAANGLPANGPSECWVPFEMLRPAPEKTPDRFEGMLTLGTLVEMSAEGGWWEVELLGASAGRWAEPSPTAAPAADGELARAPGAAASPPAQGDAPASASAEAAADGDSEIEVEVDMEVEMEAEVEVDAGAEMEDAGSYAPAAAALAAAEAAAKAQSERAAKAAARAKAAAEAAERVRDEVNENELTRPIMYTVRLLNAPSEGVGLYEVPLAELRPGWQWKSGRWAGRWGKTLTKAEERKLDALGLKAMNATGDGLEAASPASAGASGPSPAKKQRKMSTAAQRAGSEAVSEATQALALSKMKALWPLGSKVEVVQSDDGLVGGVVRRRGHRLRGSRPVHRAIR